MWCMFCLFCFFFNDTATTEIYTLSLHDVLPISRDRRGEHPRTHLARYTGILQADAYSGYNELFEPGRIPGMIQPAFCWAHARRNFFKLADIAAAAQRKSRGKNPPVISPLAMEAVLR